MSSELEPVFVAANEAEESAVERLLAEAGLRFDIALAAADDAPGGAVCYLRVEYCVAREDAQSARALLFANGFAGGVVAPRG